MRERLAGARSRVRSVTPAAAAVIGGFAIAVTAQAPAHAERTMPGTPSPKSAIRTADLCDGEEFSVQCWEHFVDDFGGGGRHERTKAKSLIKNREGEQGLPRPARPEGPAGTIGAADPRGSQNPQRPQNPQGVQSVQGSQDPQAVQNPQGTQDLRGSQNPQETQDPRGLQDLNVSQKLRGGQNPKRSQGTQGRPGSAGLPAKIHSGHLVLPARPSAQRPRAPRNPA